MMVAANALNCVPQAVFAVLLIGGQPRLWQMMLLSALGGTGRAFANPAAEGMLMSSVRGGASRWSGGRPRRGRGRVSRC